MCGTGGLSSRYEELLCERSARETVTFDLYANVQVVKRDIVTAVIYCYITTVFHYAKRDSRCLSAYKCSKGVSDCLCIAWDFCFPRREKKYPGRFTGLSNEYIFTYVPR